MALFQSKDPVTLTSSIVERFGSLSVGEIDQARQRARRTASDSPEVELLEALQNAKRAVATTDIPALGELWNDIYGCLEEVERSPNLRSVRKITESVFRPKLSANVTAIVESSIEAADGLRDNRARLDILVRAEGQISELLSDFGDFPSIDELEAKWCKPLCLFLEKARAEEKEMRAQEKEIAKTAKAEHRRRMRDAAKGRCEACGKEPRILTKLASGQGICRTCLTELRPPRPKHLATEAAIENLRDAGFQVSDELTREEAKLMGEYRHLAYHYALDLWEDVRGVRVIHDDLIPGYNQRGEVAELVDSLCVCDPKLMHRLAVVQRGREQHDPRPAPRRDRDYKTVARALAARFRGFKRPGFFGTLLP